MRTENGETEKEAPKTPLGILPAPHNVDKLSRQPLTFRFY